MPLRSPKWCVNFAAPCATAAATVAVLEAPPVKVALSERVESGGDIANGRVRAVLRPTQERFRPGGRVCVGNYCSAERSDAASGALSMGRCDVDRRVSVECVILEAEKERISMCFVTAELYILPADYVHYNAAHALLMATAAVKNESVTAAILFRHRWTDRSESRGLDIPWVFYSAGLACRWRNLTLCPTYRPVLFLTLRTLSLARGGHMIGKVKNKGNRM